LVLIQIILKIQNRRGFFNFPLNAQLPLNSSCANPSYLGEDFEMQATINNFLNELSKNPQWTNFKSDVTKKFNSELNKLKHTIGQEKWTLAEKNYNDFLRKLAQAQKQADQEIQKALKSIKKSAAEVEKTLAQYKTIALKQKAKVKKQALAKKTTAAQKTSSPKKVTKSTKATSKRKKSSKA
jgi:hypothetical protein